MVAVLEAKDLFEPQFQVRIVAQLVRDERFAAAVLPFIRPEHFSDLWAGRYLAEAVGWLRWWRELDTGPRPVTLPRHVFEQWAAEWVARQRGEVDHHRAAWVRLAWDLYDAPEDAAAAEYARQRAFAWVVHREEMLCLIEAKAHLEQGGTLGDFGLARRVERAEAIPHQASDLGVWMGFDPRAEVVRALSEPGRQTLPLGYAQYDAACGGGMARAEHWVPLAPPNVGKTTLCAAWAGRWAVQGLLVAVVQGEQPAPSFRDKVIGGVSGLMASELVKDPYRYEAWLAYLGRRGGGVVVRDFPALSFGVPEVESWLGQVEAALGRWPDVVIVDYDELVKSPTSYLEYRHRVHENHLLLRGLAQRRNHLSIVPSQTNRGAVKQDVINLDDIAECFAKSGCADGMPALCQTPDEYERGELRIFFAKNRWGPKHVMVPYRIVPAIAKLEESERREAGVAAVVEQARRAAPRAEPGLYVGYGMAERPPGIPA